MTRWTCRRSPAACVSPADLRNAAFPGDFDDDFLLEASQKPNSAFLQTLTERGFLNQCSDPATLDAAMRQGLVMAEVAVPQHLFCHILDRIDGLRPSGVARCWRSNGSRSCL
jgi:hypothetical protein